VLDVIFHEADNSCYCLDVMMWRGYSLYDAGAECRLFWLDSKLREEGLLGVEWQATLAGSGPGAAAAAGGGDMDVSTQQQQERGETIMPELHMVDASEQLQQQNGHQQQREQQTATYRCVLGRLYAFISTHAWSVCQLWVSLLVLRKEADFG
jgi:hypothetical protein